MNYGLALKGQFSDSDSVATCSLTSQQSQMTLISCVTLSPPTTKSGWRRCKNSPGLNKAQRRVLKLVKYNGGIILALLLRLS